MSTGGKLEYAFVPSSSVFATWGGKITDTTATTNTQAAADANKKIAIFWFGINDVQSSDLAIRNDASLFRSNYENLIDLYHQTNPDSSIVVLSILTTSTQEKDYYEGQEDNILAYNKELQALCQEKNYTYLDITSLYTGDECFAEGDYIHFSKEWYETAFLPYIYEALKLEID
jgi:lysophospholipase L1-like esterase